MGGVEIFEDKKTLQLVTIAKAFKKNHNEIALKKGHTFEQFIEAIVAYIFSAEP